MPIFALLFELHSPCRYISQSKFPLLYAVSKASLGLMTWILLSDAHFLMEC